MNDEQEFNWDDANVGHLARHGVSPFEAEEAVLDPHAILLEIRTRDEERVKAVGATSSGRILVAYLHGEARQFGQLPRTSLRSQFRGCIWKVNVYDRQT